MAFVFRSKTNPLKATLTPGPGQYIVANKTKQSGLSTAPFNQTSPRKIWQENSLPGPGAYEVEQPKSNEKAIIKNCGNAFAIFETPIESAIFKSHSKRFQDNQESLPGPGQYSIEVEKTPKQRTTSQSNSLHKYLQKSRNMNSTDKDVGLLAIGEEEEKNKESQAQSCYVKKEKKLIPFQSRQERCKPVRPQTSLGPGSYEINKAKQQKQCMNRKKVAQSIIKFRKSPPEEFLNDLQINKQKEEPKRQFTKMSYNSKKDDFFGSSVSRFATGTIKDYIPGPGEYEVDKVKSSSNLHLPYRKPAFGRSSQDSQMREVFISPFQVNNPNQRPAKQQKRKSVQGCFIFKEPRFKQIKTNETYSSLTVSANQLFLGKQNKQKHQKSKNQQHKYSSKLLIKRQVRRKAETDQRPLSYASQAFTISAKNKQKCQINAPFLSHVNRFNQNITSVAAEFESLYCQSTAITEYKQKDCSSNANRSIKPKGVMDSKNPRFNYQQSDSHLSPFTYDPVKPKTKQFNKLFL